MTGAVFGSSTTRGMSPEYPGVGASWLRIVPTVDGGSGTPAGLGALNTWFQFIEKVYTPD